MITPNDFEIPINAGRDVVNSVCYVVRGGILAFAQILAGHIASKYRCRTDVDVNGVVRHHVNSEITSHRSQYDVVLAACVRWDSAFTYAYCSPSVVRSLLCTLLFFCFEGFQRFYSSLLDNYLPYYSNCSLKQ